MYAVHFFDKKTLHYVLTSKLGGDMICVTRKRGKIRSMFMDKEEIL